MNDTRLPNNDEVICPNCCHQFRAIPVNVQTRIAKLEEALRDLIDAATDLDITSYDYNAVLARAESALAKEDE